MYKIDNIHSNTHMQNTLKFICKAKEIQQSCISTKKKRKRKINIQNLI